MSDIHIPIRYYQDFPGGYDYAYESLALEFSECTFLLVDVDGSTPNPVTEHFIAPALASAREVGMRVAYVHNDLRLVADPGNIVGEFWGKTKYADGGNALDHWKNLPADYEPSYLNCVRPRAVEPNFPKWIWSGFHDTFLDQHLRSWGTRTLIVVGYSRRACMHYTCAEAVGRNYRVILLRDCSNGPEIEFPDTVDESLPERGWLNKIVLRNFEHLIGYTSTSQEFQTACTEYYGTVAVAATGNGVGTR
ncbi:MAG: isochorismatase family protein [Candidatus Latescibacterota bacterium]|nr:isochorismatase family protein [Candidatus Latescibacterota bacterium]